MCPFTHKSAGDTGRAAQAKEKRIREAAKQAAASYTCTSGAWISKGLVVKVMAEELEDYYKRKGEVVAVADQYVAHVEMLDSGDVLRIDQVHRMIMAGVQ
jgi:adenylate kinase family enzyme